MHTHTSLEACGVFFVFVFFLFVLYLDVINTQWSKTEKWPDILKTWGSQIPKPIHFPYLNISYLAWRNLLRNDKYSPYNGLFTAGVNFRRVLVEKKASSQLTDVGS